VQPEQKFKTHFMKFNMFTKTREVRCLQVEIKARQCHQQHCSGPQPGFRVQGKNTLLEDKIFVFIICLKQIFLGTTESLRPVATACSDLKIAASHQSPKRTFSNNIVFQPDPY